MTSNNGFLGIAVIRKIVLNIFIRVKLHIKLKKNTFIIIQLWRKSQRRCFNGWSLNNTATNHIYWTS